MASSIAIARALAIAKDQGNVISRRQLYAAGVTRWQVRAQLTGQRWQRRGRQTVSTHTAELSESAQRWCAILEVGPRAALDGITSLQEAGLHGFSEQLLHVIVPKSANPLHPRGVRVHESRRFRESDITEAGIRRVVTPVAAVHAALWAKSDRQAALILVMTVQQRLTTAAEIQTALDEVRRHRRRRGLQAVLADIGGGSESLGELDVLSGLRRRGLPEPDRQSLRRLPSGQAWLDVEWDDWQLVLEIDGSQHDAADHRVADVLRDIDVTAGGSSVLRIPLYVWRIAEEDVLDRLAALFEARRHRRAVTSAYPSARGHS
jgi:hypothetical protein